MITYLAAFFTLAQLPPLLYALCEPTDPSLSPRAGRCGARPEEPVAISSSPDGRDIYVATAHRVTVLRVNARSGALRFGGCLGDGAPAAPVTPAPVP